MTTAPAASPPIIHALDHVVVAVRDLDAAVAVYRALLGRAPAWRAEAHGGGATVVTFALANVAVELMAPSGMGPTAERLTAVLDAQGEGLASLAFATGDIERAHRRLARLGLGPEPIADGASTDAETGATRAWGARLLFFRCGNLIVEVAHDLKSGVGDGPDRLWGLSWRVPDAEAARARLAAAGLDVSEVRPGRKPGTRVLTLRDGTCGVPTLLLERGSVADEV